MKLEDLRVGDYVGGWVETFTRHDGAEQDLLYAVVLRVNRVTVTIRDQNGRVQRIDPYHLDGKAPQYVIDALRDEGNLP